MKLAVLTSGGDAPGMNAAVRAVVRTALGFGWEVAGIYSGYRGLLDGQLVELKNRDVGGILQRGGTFLGTARSRTFATPEGQERAAAILKDSGVEALVVIGGEGSLTGASKLEEYGVKVAGIPATIDNDVWGTETAIGVDTALNTALDAVDKIKDTASAHRRAHVIEVMGRNNGYLALMSAIAGGAEAVLVPEFESSAEDLIAALRHSWDTAKPHFIIIAAEGSPLKAEEFHDRVNAIGGVESRLTVLGHIQRGGSPIASDRILASRMGAAAVKFLEAGESGFMVASQGGRMTSVPIKEIVGKSQPLDREIYEMAETLVGFPGDLS